MSSSIQPIGMKTEALPHLQKALKHTAGQDVGLPQLCRHVEDIDGEVAPALAAAVRAAVQLRQLPHQGL